MTAPLVSIVTTSFNQAAFLEETIRSVLAQDYEPVEYLVIDDGSDDGSDEIVRSHAAQLTWFEIGPNRGQPAALNRAFAHAQGELLGFVSSDDTLLPGAVTRLVREFEREPRPVLAYGGAAYVDEHGRSLGPVPSLPWDLRRFARTGIQPNPQPASLWSRPAWELAGPFDEGSWALFDTEFFLKAGHAGPVARVPETLATFRLHPRSKQLSSQIQMAEDCVRFADRFYRADNLPPALRSTARAGRASFYRRAALNFYSAGETARARRLFLRSLFLSPRGITRSQAQRLVRSLVPEGLVRRRRAGRR